MRTLCRLLAALRLAIGIPTRNRAELAMAAIGSVLRAAHGDVAVIVSDNSTDAGERRRLQEFCARSEVEYVRPREPLPMPQHWEWLWHQIRERVRPTHVSYLTDRMVFTAGSLEQVMGIVEAQPDKVLSYRHDRVEDIETPVKLVQSQWTGRLLELKADRIVELSSRAAYGDHLPRMLNSIAPVSVLARIEERFGNVFESVSPDYAFAFRSLALCDTMLYLDRACLIHYGMRSSGGISYLRGRLNEAATSFERSLSVPRFGATPEPELKTIANAIFQEYCSARDQSGGSRFPPVDHGAYLWANAESIARIEDPAWRQEMEAILRRHGWTRRSNARFAGRRGLSMTGYFLRHPGAFARSVKRQLWDRPPGTPAARLLPRLGLNPRLRDDLMFDSSSSAIAYAETCPRRRTPYSWHVHPLIRAGAIVRASEPPPARQVPAPATS